MMMKDNVKTTLTLLLLGIISAVSISLMANYANPIIESNREKTMRRAILQVLPGVTRYTVVDQKNHIFRGTDKNGEVVGYAFVGEGGGYQGVIKLMIGVRSDLRSLAGLIVLENLETPGLGAKISTDSFLKQFLNIAIRPPIEYVLNKPPREPNQIQGITGATISSRAVVKIVNDTVSERVPGIVQEAS